MPEFKLPEDFSELHPEEQEKWRQREKENKQRLNKEQLLDLMYKQKQESKLLREIEDPKKPIPTKKSPEKEKTERERQQVEEFLSKQKGEEKKKEKEDKALKELMSDPSIMVQEPPGGYKCMNQIGGKPCGEEATMKLLHGGLLGDTPPITLCKDCSKLLKILTIGGEDPELELRLRRKQIDVEMGKWEKSKKKKKKKKDEVSGPPTAQSISMKRSEMHKVLQKISKLANRLDAKGLHDEASLLDKILRR